MNGLELSRKFYLQYGKPMLEREFADHLGEIAVGIAGEGSECLGYDDDLSRDHDFEAGFCMWITKEAEREYGFVVGDKQVMSGVQLKSPMLGIIIPEHGIISPAFTIVVTHRVVIPCKKVIVTLKVVVTL